MLDWERKSTKQYKVKIELQDRYTDMYNVYLMRLLKKFIPTLNITELFQKGYTIGVIEPSDYRLLQNLRSRTDSFIPMTLIWDDTEDNKTVDMEYIQERFDRLMELREQDKDIDEDLSLYINYTLKDNDVKYHIHLRISSFDQHYHIVRQEIKNDGEEIKRFKLSTNENSMYTEDKEILNEISYKIADEVFNVAENTFRLLQGKIDFEEYQMKESDITKFIIFRDELQEEIFKKERESGYIG